MTDDFGDYILVTILPTYFKDAWKVSIQESGILSAVPFVCLAVSTQISGRLADYFREGYQFSTVTVRKAFNTFGFLARAIFLLVVCFADDKNIAICGFTFALTFGGFNMSGYGVNYLDIAPRYASILLGFGNTLASIPGFVAPKISTALIPNGTKEEWRNVFYVSASQTLFQI